MTARKFDAAAFAVRISARLGKTPLRTAAVEAGVSYVTLARAANGWDHLSVENFLRLSAWLGDVVEVREAA